MNNNNFSHDYESSLQTTTYDIHTPSNNVNNSISDHVTDHNHQQPNVVSLNHNHQQYQYIQQPGIPNNTVTITPDHNQQPSNVTSNNNITISSDDNHHASNNIHHHNNQHSMPNNETSPLTPQFCHDQNQHNPPQSNILPLLNPFGVSINYPQAPIIIMSTTNSDIQNQLQQVLAYLNHSSSTQTRFNTQ
ncbi:hypothetical protein RclHR1_06270002 [Rhizophagus clarus]|uniref:Uncharacterized protein n=1 Tax=Rhizophagus clarus TaxID=94130 RepID=A0A2Z6SHZ5_9GLOM|nr:hypothetical protein RclHR1_06270002 [Rhizophagus clarus]GES95844.1 hypothetical protein GLOIN_2v1880782 [Rhizophagus clarus]